MAGHNFICMQGGTDTEEEEGERAASRDHLQSTSRMDLTVLMSSFASWASVAAVQGFFLYRDGGP